MFFKRVISQQEFISQFNFTNSSTYFRRILKEVSSFYGDYSIITKSKEISKTAFIDLTTGIYDAIAQIINMKADFSEMHSQKVAKYCLAMAQSMGLDLKSQNLAYYAGLFHDIGKNHIPDTILYKEGKLDNSEWVIMSMHSEISWEILSKCSLLQDEADIARAHHVKGYKGLDSNSIITKILIIADAFDAMTNTRCYRTPLPVSEAYEEIERCLDRHFDRKVYKEAFQPWYDNGLKAPIINNVITPENRHPELFSASRTTNQYLKDFYDIEIQFVELLVLLATKTDMNLRGYNPQTPATYSYNIAKEMGLPVSVRNDISRAALLGGLGQMFMRDETTVVGQTEAETIKDMRKFALKKDQEVFTNIPSFVDISVIIHGIYESFDGKRSVFGLKGESIPLESRIVRVAVGFYFFKGDLDQIKKMAGHDYDPEVVKALISYLEKEET